MRRLAALATLLAASLAASPAFALVAAELPDAVPVSSATTDILTFSGNYSALPTPIAQPFAATAFTLQFALPSAVTFVYPTAFSNLIAPSDEFAIAVSGTYTNGGQTESFTGANATAFFYGSTTNPAFGLDVSNLLTGGDNYSVTLETTAPLYTISGATGIVGSGTGTFTLGAFTVTSGDASYFVPTAVADPGLTGSGTITAQNSVPEPATMALLAAPLAGLAFLRRRRA